MRRQFRVPIWGLMAIVAVAAILLLVVKASWPGWAFHYRSWQTSRPAYAQLGRPVALRYPNGVELRELLDAVQKSTRCQELPSGIPIYVDDLALQKAGATLWSPVTISTQGEPLEESLRAALSRHGLDFFVQEGMLTITQQEACLVWGLTVEGWALLAGVTIPFLCFICSVLGWRRSRSKVLGSVGWAVAGGFLQAIVFGGILIFWSLTHEPTGPYLDTSFMVAGAMLVMAIGLVLGVFVGLLVSAGFRFAGVQPATPPRS